MVPINKRKIGVCILLSIVTFGIYKIYWEYLLVKNTRAIQKDESSCTGEMLCLVFVPFYSLFWWFTRGKIVKDKFAEHGYSAIGNEIAYLILGIFGCSIVSMAIMQNDFNSLKSESTQSIQRSTKKAKKGNKGTIITISIIVAVVLVVALSITLSFFSGRHDGVKYKIYTEEGLQYKLPKNFKATNYNYGEVEYSNGEGAYFFFTAFDETELTEDQFLPADITPQEFAQALITAWRVDSEYEYHSEDGSVTFDYHIEEDGEYYLHLIVRGSEEIFLFTLSCDSSEIDEYASMFGYIFNSIIVE